jgi:hypothetical protein
MNDAKLREALLKQEPAPTIEQELTMLRKLEESTDRRARRLAFATIVAWVLFPCAILTLFVLPMLLAQNPPMKNAPPPRAMSTVAQVLVSSAALVALIGAVTLPVVGLVLLILSVASRRSANITQLRTSLMAIEARLDQLATLQQPGGPPSDIK